MALHDVDRSGVERGSPLINSKDTQGRMANGTTSVNPVTDATPVDGFIQTANSRALVNDGTYKRISMGVHADQTVGLKISQNGVDVDTATSSQLLFDSNQSIYKIVDSTATVVSTGLSDSPDIQAAINQVMGEGGGTVVLKNGTYLMNSSISVPSNVTLSGETSGGVIIDFQNTSNQILIAGDTAYTTGTVFTSTGSTSVSGIGTAWTSAMIGQQIFLGGLWYLIDAVGSATSLTIDTPFAELNITTSEQGGVVFAAIFPAVFGMITGSAYAIANPVSSATVITMTVQNSTHSNGAVFYQYATGCIYDTVNVFSSTVGVNFYAASLITAQGFFSAQCTTGIQIILSGVFTLYNFETFDCSGNGVLANNFINTSVSNFTLSSSGLANASLTNCQQWGFFDATITSGLGAGMELTSCSDIQIFSMNIQSNAGDGIHLVASNVFTSMLGIVLRNNGNYGIDVNASTNTKNSITNCFFDSNTAGSVFDGGIHTIDANNQT